MSDDQDDSIQILGQAMGHEAAAASIDLSLTVDADWKPADQFKCRACGDIARTHPQTTHIWGCLTCGFTTAAVATFFTYRL